MNSNLMSLVFSATYVLLAILICKVLERFMDKFTVRKILHLLAGNAVLIPLVLGADLWAMATLPLVFMFANSELVKRDFFEKGIDDEGLVFYPFSILLLVFLTYFTGEVLYLIVPTLIMAYGDAIAGLVGRNIFGHEQKSLEGSLAMFMTALLVMVGVNQMLHSIHWFWMLLIPAVATWAERLENDNLTVPLFTAMALLLMKTTPAAIITGLGVSLMLSSFAFYLRALDRQGLVAAVLLGTTIFSVSAPFFVVTMTFFFSSAIATTFKKKAKAIMKDFQKTGKRDAVQVLANGFGIFFATALHASGVNAMPFAVAAVAAATADTWATEIGVLSKYSPRLITNLRKHVQKGRSGGVTWLGLMASAFGGLTIFLAAYPFFGIATFTPAIIGAVVGSFLDSLFGATAQALYECRVCNKMTEKKIHCRRKATLIQGQFWFNNDLVNMTSTLIAAGLVML